MGIELTLESANLFSLEKDKFYQRKNFRVIFIYPKYLVEI